MKLSEEVRRRWARRLPPRGVPIAYFAFAHACLGLAFAVVAADPWSVAGFFYHPRMLAVVHLITLGWITCAILGALYLVAPMALGIRLPTRRADVWACVMVAVGVAGMVGHFWIDEPSGLAWSGGLLLAGFAIPASRFLRALGSARLPLAARLPFVFAFFNFLLAASLGLVIGIDKILHVVPGHIHARVYAHAHLAAIGWAMTMAIATGNRLLPMLLPSAMPGGRSLLAGALILEAGVLGLFAALLIGPDSAPVFFAAVGLTVLGLGIFGARIVWMLRHRREPRRPRPGFDLGLWHIAQALAYLAVSVALGVALAVGSGGVWELAAVMVYGVAALLGFLGQLVVAVSPWLFAHLAWLWASAQDSLREPVTSPRQMSSRALRAAILVLWTLGVPALAWALAGDRIPLLRLAGTALLLAVILQVVDLARVLRHAAPRRDGPVS